MDNMSNWHEVRPLQPPHQRILKQNRITNEEQMAACSGTQGNHSITVTLVNQVLRKTSQSILFAYNIAEGAEFCDDNSFIKI